MESVLFQATLYLTAMVIAVPLSVRLGLGSVLGYLMAGIALAPILKSAGGDPHGLQHFAEFGVVMMLFMIGLELNPRGLWEMKGKLLGLGGSQVALTAGVITGGAILLGVAFQTALAIGLIFALSSTAIVLQTLTEKGLMRSPGGRSAFSVLLTQDIAVIPMLALLPLLGQPPAAAFSPDGSIGRPAMEEEAATEAGLSLVANLPAWGVAAVTIGAVLAIILAGYYLTRPLFHFIHVARLREMYTAVALVIVVGIAFLMTLVGLSPALGAFIAGLVMAGSEFKHELESDIAPFKGLLLGLFFITVGAGIHFEVLWANPFTIIGATFAIVLIKGLILYIIGTAFSLRGRERWLFALSLAQAGEFGFVLVSLGLSQHVFSEAMAEMLLIIVALSMLLTPLLFILQERISALLHDHDAEDHVEEEIDDQGCVIIVGIGRFGQIVNRMIQMSNLKTVVLDNNMSSIRLMRRFGVKGYFGDPTRPDLLHSAGLETAKAIVVAVDEREAALKLVRYARAKRPDIHIVARAYDRVNAYELKAAGADDVVREMFDSSLRAGRYVLENTGFSEYEAHEAQEAFYYHDRHALLELADLWKPGVPIAENEAYMLRARELNNTLEAAIAADGEGAEVAPEEK